MQSIFEEGERRIKVIAGLPSMLGSDRTGLGQAAATTVETAATSTLEEAGGSALEESASEGANVGEDAAQTAAEDAPKGVNTNVRNYLSQKAPMVSPGTNTMTGVYVNNLGQAEPWMAPYVAFGRMIGCTDIALGDSSQGIDPIHYHMYSYDGGNGD